MHIDWTEELEAEFQQINNYDLTIKDIMVRQEKKKGINNAFEMIVEASPTTKHALLACLSGVGVNTEPV